MIEVEWDAVKANSNLEKHGIDFEDAKNIFLDEARLERQDPHDYGETRFQAIGMVDGIILFVVYTRRNGRYRIISAQRASRNERKRYYQS